MYASPRTYPISENLARYSIEEQQARIELAAAFRLFEYFGWTDIIYNHLTVAVPGKPGQFLINPFGLTFDEVTASSLVAIDFEGNVVDPGSTSYGINKAGYVIHSAIHGGRSDIKAVMHCHSINGVAVSCHKDGLLTLTQNAQLVHHEVNYHTYEGISVDISGRERIVKDLGPTKKIMILRNHGLLTLGSSIAEAFWLMFALNKACDIQVAVLSSCKESDLIYPHPEAVSNTEKMVTEGINGIERGELEFKALQRRIDRIDPSYRE